MKKLLAFFFTLALLLPVFAERNNIVIVPLQEITATGGLNDLNVGPYTRNAAFRVLAKSSNGTNPTCTMKLQSAGLPAVGANYTTSGSATDNKLRAGATTTVKLAAMFTQSGTKSVKYCDLFLKKAGTLTAGKLLTLTVNTDSTGSPSDTAVGTASDTVDIDTYVTTSYSWVRFTFSKPVDLSDATVYHMVLSGDYSASTSNYVTWQSTTVGSAGNQNTNNGTVWSAVTTESFMFMAQDTTFTDISGGGFTQATTTAASQALSFNLDGLVGGLVRGYATIGGTSTPKFYVALLLNAEAR